MKLLLIFVAILVGIAAADVEADDATNKKNECYGKYKMCKDAATDVQKHIECRNAFRTCNKEARKTEGKVEGSVVNTGEPFPTTRPHKGRGICPKKFCKCFKELVKCIKTTKESQSVSNEEYLGDSLMESVWRTPKQGKEMKPCLKAFKACLMKRPKEEIGKEGKNEKKKKTGIFGGMWKKVKSFGKKIASKFTGKSGEKGTDGKSPRRRPNHHRGPPPPFRRCIFSARRCKMQAGKSKEKLKECGKKFGKCILGVCKRIKE